MEKINEKEDDIRRPSLFFMLTRIFVPVTSLSFIYGTFIFSIFACFWGKASWKKLRPLVRLDASSHKMVHCVYLMRKVLLGLFYW